MKNDSNAAKASKKILEAYFETNIEDEEILKEDMSATVYNER